MNLLLGLALAWSHLISPVRVVWLSVEDDHLEVACRLVPPTAWECDDVPAGARGVTLVVGTNGEVTAISASAESIGSAITSAWGRLVWLTADSVSPDDLRDVTARAWKPDRPQMRVFTRRFAPREESGVTVIRMSRKAFWVCGASFDPDGFVRFEGPAIGTAELALTALASGAPEEPVFVRAPLPLEVGGFVVDNRNQPVDRVVVELWQALASDLDHTAGAATEWIRRATSRSDEQGAFAFTRLADVRYELVALDPTRGRASVVVRSLSEPILLRLVPPTLVSGRVLRRHAPVVGARIRFVPDAPTFANSSDPSVNLADEAQSAEDGAFSLVLPASHAGMIQILTPAGQSLRLALPTMPGAKSIALGDIAVPDAARVTLRLLDARRCGLVAVGPLGQLGMSTVRVSATPSNVYWVELPEPGTWVLSARCGDRDYAVDPPAVTVGIDDPERALDLRILG